MIHFRRRLALAISIAVIFASVNITGSFAATDTSTTAKTAPAQVTNLEAHPGYLSVILKWSKVQGADGYVVYRKVDGTYKQIALVKNGKTEYKVKKLKKYEKQTFKVNAYVDDSNAKKGRRESKGVTVKSEPVREMTYKLKVKVSTKIRPKGGQGKWLKIRSGETVEASRFTAGRYAVIKDGNFYYIPKTYVRKASGVYTTKWNYSRKSAENFINDKGTGSRTGTLMWVNTYTQHTYMFKGKKGKWKCVDDWECATGQASSPTPTGLSGKKQIWDKIRSRHGLRWWSPFSSMNSFHGMRSSWVTGKPASNGCVRTPTKKSKKVYKQAKIGTRVLVH